jgi:hypothetical protein
MYFRSIVFCTLLIVFVYHPLTGQTEDKALENVAEELVNDNEDEVASEQMAEWLNDLILTPVTINQASEEELSRLFWLTPIQIGELRKYISKYGALVSINEFVNIPGFTQNDAERLSPYISFAFTDSALARRNNLSPISWLLLRSQRIIEHQQGYEIPENPTPSNHFTGNEFRHYLRYSFRANEHYSLGITAEKDAGEEFFTGSNPHGFDFFSGYVKVSNLNYLKTLVVGDYKMSFGQGLAVNSSFSPGLMATYGSVVKSGEGITHNQSADENRFFRGVAVTLRFRPIDISVWYSNHKIDGNLVTDSSKNQIITSLQTSGIHATPAEIEDENAVRAEVAGSHLSFNHPNLKFGITALGYRYSLPIAPPYKLYNQYYFRGKENFNLSANYKYRYHNLLIFGEEALSKNGGIALLNGIEAMLHSRFSLNLLHRYYQRQYQSMYGNAFGRNSSNSNESGLYAGCRLNPLPNTEVSIGLGIYSFPWLKYGVDMPSDGRDLSLRISFTPSKTLTIDMLYRNRLQEQNADSVSNPPSLIETNKQRCMGKLRWKATENIALQSRVELATYHPSLKSSKGYYMGQDIEFRNPDVPFKITAHYAFFDIEDFNSRIYVYESDLLYTFSIPGFSDKGTRAFLLLQWSINKNLNLWIKYSTTHYTDAQNNGSGLYAINGDKKSEIKFQVVAKF